MLTSDHSALPFTSPKRTKCLALPNARKPCQGQSPRYTGKVPPPLRYTPAQPSPHWLPQLAQRAGSASGRRKQTVPAGEPGSDLSRGTLPAAHSQAQPLAAPARAPHRRHPPKLSPAACARSASPPGLNALSLPPCRGDGEAGSLPPSSPLPPPPRPGSPARRSLAEAPALHRRAGARRCPPAPRRRPRPRLAV